MLDEDTWEEVEPVEYKKKGETVWYYDEINYFKISLIGYDGLEEILNKRAKKGQWKVTEEEECFYLKFVMKDIIKPLLIISESGEIFSSKKQWDTLDHAYIRHQAGILIGILHRERLVKRARHRYFSYNKYGEQIKEEIPSEETPRRTHFSKKKKEHN